MMQEETKNDTAPATVLSTVEAARVVSWAEISYREAFPTDLAAMADVASAGLQKDGRIGLVTPPGCGRMLLGIELMRRSGQPCLLITQSREDMDAWTICLTENFLSSKGQGVTEPASSAAACCSENVHHPALLTMTTYEMLLASMPSVDSASETRYGRSEEESEEAFCRGLRAQAVGMILLDEPYVCAEEAFAAVSRLIDLLGGVQVLSLSALPPDHLDPLNRRTRAALCGEITGEFSIPDLIRHGVLSPHRDLIYFTEPTPAEADAWMQIWRSAANALNTAMALPFVAKLGERLYHTGRAYLYGHYEEALASAALLGYAGDDAARRVAERLSPTRSLPPLTLTCVETALNFFLRSRTLLSSEEKRALAAALTPGAMKNGHVTLRGMSSLDRTMAMSEGKIRGVLAILRSEAASLQTDLRFLIVAPAGDDARGGTCRAEDIFREASLTGTAPTGMVLSDGQVILPGGLTDDIRRLAEVEAWEEPDENLRQVRAGRFYRFGCFSDALYAVERLFDSGIIRVLTIDGPLADGGWVERVANTLVLTVPCTSPEDKGGVYARLRARMLRTRRSDRNRVVHIWHMATVMIPDGTARNDMACEMLDRSPMMRSPDLAALTAFFDATIGIEHADDEGTTAPVHACGGILRISSALHTPPKSRKSVEAHNQCMLADSRERSETERRWQRAIRAAGWGKTEELHTITAVRVPRAAGISMMSFQMVAGLVLSLAGMAVSGFLLPHLVTLVGLAAGGMLSVLLLMTTLLLLDTGALVLGAMVAVHHIRLMYRHRRDTVSIHTLCHALLDGMQRLGQINPDAALHIYDEDAAWHTGMQVVSLTGASRAESERFCRAVMEFFSPIGAMGSIPRDILVRRGWFGRPQWAYAFACPPSVYAGRETVSVFGRSMSRALGRVTFIYARRFPGRIGEARSRAHIGRLEEGCTRWTYL